MPCGCHIFVDHEQGDRKMKCDHLKEWVIRAVTYTTTTYRVDVDTNPVVQDG